MKTLLLHITIGLFTFSAFGQGNEAKLLNYSYKRSDKHSLDMFFSKWENEYQPITQNQLDNFSDTISDVYTIFKDFYFKSNAGLDRRDSLHHGVEYVVVQNRIDFASVETLDKALLKNHDLRGIHHSSIEYEYLHKDSIMDFRPNLDFDIVGVLYYKSKYTETVSEFLNKHYRLDFGGIMNLARAKGKSKSRSDWINSKIPLSLSHWGEYWYIMTFPRVSLIVFDKERNTALVHFSRAYTAGEALYKKIDNDWTLIDSKITATE